MKLEYLDDLTDAGKYPKADPIKLIRLFSFGRDEAEKLRNVIQFWVLRKNESVEISALPFVTPINCELTFDISNEDIGIIDSPDCKFICRLSVSTYRNMVGAINAFCTTDKEMSGFNWLYDPGTDKIDLLFSPGGTW